MGRHLGIDFGAILVDFGRQVGVENRAKIDPKRHRKSDKLLAQSTPSFLALLFATVCAVQLGV